MGIGGSFIFNREGIFYAWRKMARGKWHQGSVQQFWLREEAELASLYHDLARGTYKHGGYRTFTIADTKRREIAEASVRDRVVHELLAQHLEKIYAPIFIPHSYAAQKGKGVAAARVYVFARMQRALRVHGQIWIAKLDVKQFYANVRHDILMSLIGRRVKDHLILRLCQEVIQSFGANGRGLPLGNHTSQWFANIYLHEIDWYAKHTLRIRTYMRYNDDMILVDRSAFRAWSFACALASRAKDRLHLMIPSDKINMVSLPDKAVDVLGMCTNGRTHWVRQQTAASATVRLAKKWSESEVTLLDTMAAYYGNGITWDFLGESAALN